MKLRRFTGTGVHGFRDFNVRFNADLTFLTGINGTGKTTVLNAIVALISPLLPTLAELEYNTIKIEFENDGDSHSVEAIKEGRSITLHASATTEVFVFNRFLPDQESPSPREEHDYYHELLIGKAEHPVLRFIAGLPTPMFLGLDRRARFSEDPVRGRPWATRSRMGRNVFSPSISQSLVDAAHLAETRYREILLEAARAGETLRREMLLRLLMVEPAKGFGPLTPPTNTDRRDIKAMRQYVQMLPQILNLPPDEVNKRIDPFLDQLEQYAAEIPRDINIDDILRSRGVDKPAFQALVGWSVNISQLTRIRFISEMVSKHNDAMSKLKESTTRYQDLVNGFLRDSGKSVIFDANGYLSYSIEGVSNSNPISSLSSGEAQIFVILSHLSFNQYAQRANVFIIDEPELSLHIQWQELFVRGLP